MRFKSERLSLVAGKDVLCLTLQLSQVVIFDNANFHKSSELHVILAEVDCKLIFLPHSPDLNPIGTVWANLKKSEKVIKKSDDFRQSMTQAVHETFPGIAM